jgi:hypothetical protein
MGHDARAEAFGRRLAGGLAKDTYAMYGAAFQRFAESLRGRGIDPMAATDMQVALYLDELIDQCAQSGAGPATLRVASAAIACFLGLAGRDAPQGTLCKRIMAAAERELTVQRRPREPVQVDILRHVLHFHLVAQQPELQTRMHLTCMLLMFVGLLRYDDMASVLVHKDLLRWVRGSNGQLDGVLLFIPRGKRDQIWEGKWTAIGATGQSLCPVLLLQQLLASGGYVQSPSVGQDAGPLLRKVTKQRGMQQQLKETVVPIEQPMQPLGAAALRPSMRALFKDAGVQGVYSLHSLRIGGATAARAAGCDSALVEAHGRWARHDTLIDIYTRVLETDVQRFFGLTRQFWPW